MAAENILQEIAGRIRQELPEAKRKFPAADLERLAAIAPLRPDFRAALRNGPKVIAELKRASPSKGLIRRDFPVRELAIELTLSGAAALSVLTEKHYFLGALENLKIAAAAVEIPLLRKDFIIDEYQILEARCYGASAVLLIAALLEPARLMALYDFALSQKLAVLLEVHDEAELALALELGAPVIGVNCRDLRTFRTDLAVTERLLEKIPASVTAVAESGIGSRADMLRLHTLGADAFLIGETLMRAPSPGAALEDLLK